MEWETIPGVSSLPSLNIYGCVFVCMFIEKKGDSLKSLFQQETSKGRRRDETFSGSNNSHGSFRLVQVTSLSVRCLGCNLH